MSKYVYLVFHLGELVYVGSTFDVETRIKQHWADALHGTKRAGLCDFMRTHSSKSEYSHKAIYLGEDWARIEEETIAKYKKRYPNLLNRSSTAVGNSSPLNRTRYWIGKRPEAAIAASVKARTGKKLSPEHVAKIVAGTKKSLSHLVICNETGQEFASYTEAALRLNLTMNSIRRSVISGKPHKGMTFRRK